MSRSTPAQDSERRRGFSILQRLLALIVLLVLGVVALFETYLPAGHIAEMRGALETKALTYATLISKQVEPAIAFDDRQTAREVFESIAADPDLASLTLLTARGEVLSAFGSATPGIGTKKAGTRPELVPSADRLSVIAPVVSLEGPRGTLILELSQARLIAQKSAVERQALVIGALALVLGVLGASLIAVSLSRRLQKIAVLARAVAAGELEQPPLEVKGRLDEIGYVAIAFNAMLEHIRRLVDQIRSAARDEQAHLERLVRTRTADLDEKNADLTRLLDNIGQGFVALDREGRMSQAQSRVLREWFGEMPASGSFAELLARVDLNQGEWFALGWQSLAEGFLPIEVCLEQLPKRINLAGRAIEIDYRPLLDEEGRLDEVLVVVSDVTEQLRRARAEANEREVTLLFSKLIADRSGFVSFFWEAHELVDRVRETTESRNWPELARALHTLKGNAAMFGVETLAQLCHGLEDRLSETGGLEPEQIVPLGERWLDLSGKLRSLTEDESDKIEIVEAEYADVLAAIEGGVSRAELRRKIQAWRLEPIQLCLARVAEHARSLAVRVGKAPLDVKVEAQSIRLDRAKWSQFWAACVHVIRNAVDHGIETPSERDAAGKPATVALCLRARVTKDRFVIEFSDDGRGIDWDAVGDKARALGLPSSTPAELREALFAPGVTTKTETSELSGRGIGLNAVRQVCRALDGAVEVESVSGAGTTFRFVWPLGALALDDARPIVPSRTMPAVEPAGVSL